MVALSRLALFLFEEIVEQQTKVSRVNWDDVFTCNFARISQNVILNSLTCRKKLSNFTKTRNWKHAGNHVAKRYISDVPRETYFSDVVLQMDAKLWGEEYNRHFPPKKVIVSAMEQARSGRGMLLYVLNKYNKFCGGTIFVVLSPHQKFLEPYVIFKMLSL